ncbi:flagellar basal body P-ring formation chaperone FlgA [Paracoccus sp. MBLB3053]|uniref:Flagella basal body P-ring formation protein FlgA n=1 Tax=Paracoccus aurantius TaxID=3073814 RepID=A0ABU2HMQ4_9RHOB|nr:flagellar basal body P-ring formation chaperone FlgA [Paracoccus sp. MBLB3053]MDS9466317.1 flagellar basal body P-ring formation chaperone FlgA [Paracoccus sp. MBLB3053]
MRSLILILSALPLPVMAEAVVAARTLQAGTVLATDDLRIAPGAEGAFRDPADVIGQELRVMVTEGRPIGTGQVGKPIAVGRNALVTIAYEKAALRIEADGRALSSGAVGDVIRVMNNASRITVVGRIAPNGTVIVHEN